MVRVEGKDVSRSLEKHLGKLATRSEVTPVNDDMRGLSIGALHDIVGDCGRARGPYGNDRKRTGTRRGARSPRRNAVARLSRIGDGNRNGAGGQEVAIN